MEEIKVTEKDKSNLRWMSKLLSIFCVIGKIFIYIAIVAIIFVMAIIPSLVNHVDIKNNNIIFDYKKDNIVIKVEKNKTIFYANDEKVATEKGTESYDIIKKYYDKYSKKQLIGYSEAALIITVAYLYFVAVMLKKLSVLLGNISKEKTPFTLENLMLFQETIKYKIISLVIPLVGIIAFQIALHEDFIFSISGLNIFGLIIMFIAYYLFKYACQLQSNSKETLNK